MRATIRVFTLAALCWTASSQRGALAGYEQEVLADNPWVYYRFDETSGDVAAPGLLRMVQLEYKRIRDEKSDHWTRDEQHQWANWESVVTHGPWLAGMQLAPQGQPPAPSEVACPTRWRWSKILLEARLP